MNQNKISMFTVLTFAVDFIKVLFQNRFRIPFDELLEYGFIIFGYGYVTLSVNSTEDEFLNQKVLPYPNYRALFGILWFDYHIESYLETETLPNEVREKSTKDSMLVLSIFYMNITWYFDKEYNTEFKQGPL